MRYKLRLSYDGGPFRGFAPNEGVPTIGGALRSALEQVLQHPVSIVCAGRTDSGVHALDQMVSFDTKRPVEPEALRTSLNSLCKPHIVVSDVAAVDDAFDARFSCTGRTYRYRILNRRLPDPFRENYTWRVPKPLDIDLMQTAGEALIGTHDFSSFCRRQFRTDGPEKVEKPRTRTLRSVEWSRAGDDEVHLVISARSFCQQMVRSITGLCVDIGLGALPGPDWPRANNGAGAAASSGDVVGYVHDVLAAKDRLQVPRVAPPQGLYLLALTY